MWLRSGVLAQHAGETLVGSTVPHMLVGDKCYWSESKSTAR